MNLDDKDKEGGEQEVALGLDIESADNIEISIGADGSGEIIETADKGDKEGGEQDGAQPKLKRPGKKDGGRLQQRINTLTARASEAETVAERLRRENEELKTAKDKSDQRADKSDEVALANYESKCKEKAERAEKDLADAIETGDKDKIAKATLSGATAASEYQRVKSYREAHPAKKEGDEPAADKGGDKGGDKGEPAQQPKVSQEFIDFATENPWFLPPRQGQPNPEFRAHLHHYAVQFGLKLEQQWQAAGKNTNSPEYFNAVSEAVQKKFPEEFEGEEAAPPPKAKTPAMKQDGDQIPLRSQQSGNGNRGTGKDEKVSLNRDEIDMVKFNVENNILGNNPTTKAPYTFKEALVLAGREKVKDREKQRMLRGE